LGHKGRADPGGNRIPAYRRALTYKIFESWTPAVLSEEPIWVFRVGLGGDGLGFDLV
jgi:hypothetical protein